MQGEIWCWSLLGLKVLSEWVHCMVVFVEVQFTAYGSNLEFEAGIKAFTLQWQRKLCPIAWG